MAEGRAKLKVIAAPAQYRPILSERERRAYAAAYRIMTEQAPCAHLGTPGAKRSGQLDHIAKIIVEAMK